MSSANITVCSGTVLQALLEYGWRTKTIDERVLALTCKGLANQLTFAVHYTEPTEKKTVKGQTFREIGKESKRLREGVP